MLNTLVFIPGNSLLDGLISYWSLDEASGQRNDSHGSNHLTEVGTVSSDVGKLGNAASFIDQYPLQTAYLKCDNNPSLQVGDEDFTITTWVNLSQPASVDIISKNTGGDRGWVLVHQSPYFRFIVAPDASTYIIVTDFNTTNPTPGVWYFVVAWHDSNANTINIQINNGTVTSKSHAAGVRMSGAFFGVSYSSYVGTYRHWLVDGVGYWRRVLNVEERSALYNSGLGLFYPFTN